jgi:3',5'-cyclic-AMP phosphodiesterase
MVEPNLQGPEGDGVDRRGFLKCMAWAGTGLVWTVAGGVLASRTLGRDAKPGQGGGGKSIADFTFVQISDSHVGFNKEPNRDVTATFQEAVRRINALPRPPALILHTGDLTHLSKPEEFDTVAEILKGAKTGGIFYVPGEHDVFGDDGKQYLERHGKGTRGLGWRSFDHGGVHFIGLVNVMNLKAGGLGVLGAEQLEWLQKDVAPLKSDTPIVVFAHVPLWTIYPQWGWGTEDSAQALAHLRRFGSVTVLNGHIHQIMKKVEGNVTFHTARSLAFPQPAPGAAPSPGPIKNVPAGKLRETLGLTTVDYVERRGSLAVVDSTLA